jgi:hypothetical protein
MRKSVRSRRGRAAVSGDETSPLPLSADAALIMRMGRLEE